MSVLDVNSSHPNCEQHDGKCSIIETLPGKYQDIVNLAHSIDRVHFVRPLCGIDLDQLIYSLGLNYQQR